MKTFNKIQSALTEDQEHTNSVQSPYTCAIDAAAYSKRNARTHSIVLRTAASRVAGLAAIAYSRSKVYTNLRDNFIAVKVNNVQRLDKIEHGTAIATLVAHCTARDYDVKYVRNNVIIHIKA